MFRNTSVRRLRQLAVFAALLLATALVAHAKRPAQSGGELAPPAPPHAGKPRIEAVFVLDTTGSMSGLIERAKQKIWSIANQLADGQPAPELRMGLVGYRDRGDDYVTRVHDLSGDIDDVYAKLMQLSAGGGGDTPESVNQALHEAVTRLSWSQGEDVYRVIFLVGDAPPHMDYRGDVAYPEVVEIARGRGIVVNTIQCGNLSGTREVWTRIASATQGEYVAIAQNGAMVAMDTPMDADLARLAGELAETAVAYGDASLRDELGSKLARALEAPAAVVASRLSYLRKSGAGVASGRGDLVDAVEAGDVEAETVSDEQLPEEMRAMSPDERGSYVQQKLAERKKIQERIDDLSRERDAYVKAETATLATEGKADGFDQQVLDAVRSQAAAAGIAYE